MIYKRLQALTFCLITSTLSDQEMFPARQLTFDPAQQGFAKWYPDGSQSAFLQRRELSLSSYGRKISWVMDYALITTGIP